MKLTNIKKVGRFTDTRNGQTVNIHRGRKVGYSVDVLFYYYKFERQFISDHDFYHHWKRVD